MTRTKQFLPFIFLLLFVLPGAEAESPLIRKHTAAKHHKIARSHKRRVLRLSARRHRVVPLEDGRNWLNDRADNLATAHFTGMRGHLPWPVDSRTISMRFGLQVVGEKIRFDNRGITVDVKPGCQVYAVHPGVVVNVFEVGDVQGVTIRHGNYLTTYSNFSTLEVSKGEEVSAGCVLGQIGDAAQLEFVVSDERYRLYDPVKWLKR